MTGSPQTLTVTSEIVAWRCIGCGAIEAPQTCLGICEYHKVRFVHADEHASAVATARASAVALHRFAQKVASTKPHDGQWETSFRALQQEALQLLRGAAQLSSNERSHK